MVNIRTLLEKVSGIGAAFTMFSLILITCVDVVGRYFFAAPLAGAFELTEVLLAALIFMALPLTTERREHIEVDLISNLISARSNWAIAVFAHLFSAALLATFAWRLGVHAWYAAADGAVTNALRIPLAPFAWLASFACFISASIALIHALQQLRRSNKHATVQQDRTA